MIVITTPTGDIGRQLVASLVDRGGFTRPAARAIAAHDGVFPGALAADYPMPVVAARDIAAVATGLLLDRTWTGVGEVPVLGPEDLSPPGVAATTFRRWCTDVLAPPAHAMTTGGTR